MPKNNEIRIYQIRKLLFELKKNIPDKEVEVLLQKYDYSDSNVIISELNATEDKIICKHCGEEKPLSEMEENKTSKKIRKTKYLNICKKCFRKNGTKHVMVTYLEKCTRNVFKEKYEKITSYNPCINCKSYKETFKNIGYDYPVACCINEGRCRTQQRLFKISEFYENKSKSLEKEIREKANIILTEDILNLKIMIGDLTSRINGYIYLKRKEQNYDAS